MREITNYDDIIDSRDVIERLAELDALKEDDPYGLDEYDDEAQREHNALRDLAADGETNASDWIHGATLIRDSYFTEYAEQMAEDIGAIDREASWPLRHIDWEAAADELKTDYTEINFDGVEYWVR